MSKATFMYCRKVGYLFQSSCLSPGISNDACPPNKPTSSSEEIQITHSLNTIPASSLFRPQTVSPLYVHLWLFFWCAIGVHVAWGRAICRALNNAELRLMWSTPLLHQHSSSPSSSYLFLPTPLRSGTSSFSHTHIHTSGAVSLSDCVPVSDLMSVFASVSLWRSLRLWL